MGQSRAAHAGTGGRSQCVPFAIGKWAGPLASNRLQDFLQSQDFLFRDEHSGFPQFARRFLLAVGVAVPSDRLTRYIKLQSKRRYAFLSPMPQSKLGNSCNELRDLAHVVKAVAVLIDVGDRRRAVGFGFFHARRVHVLRRRDNQFRSWYLLRNPREQRV